MSFQLQSDKLTPALAKLARGIANRKSILQAIGSQITSLTIRAFTDAALRPAAWSPLKNGKPATLRRSGDLWHSITITSLTNDKVTVGSNKIYAAIHQLGGRAGRNHASVIPPRPFFPIVHNQFTPTAKAKILAIATAKIKALKP